MAVEAKAETHHLGGLKPVDVGLLEPGTVLAFPLYVRSQENLEFKLFQDADLPLSPAVFAQIREDFDGRAYVHPEHLESFQELTRATLTAVFSDPAKTPEEKFRALLDHADSHLEPVFEHGYSVQVPDYGKAWSYAQLVTKLLEEETNTRGLMAQFLGKRYTLMTHCLQTCMYGMMVIHHYFSDVPEEQKFEIALGFLCHDIGKAQIGSSIIEKAEKLSRREWQILFQVPSRGVSVLDEWGIQDGLAAGIVRAHREHFDGTGYPQQLAGKKIPRLARLCCIADAYSSLTSRKPYRPALSPYDALWVMRVENKGHYDPAFLKLFVALL